MPKFTLPFAAAAMVLSATAQTGDAAMGAKLFLQCRACHTVGAKDRSGLGPNLAGVVGAKAGTKAGYAYSPAMAKSGIVWTPAELDAFLKKPTGKVPGTRMAFAGVPAEKGRADMIAYLATLRR